MLRKERKERNPSPWEALKFNEVAEEGKKIGEDVDGFSCESPQEEELSCWSKLTVSLSLSLAFLQVNVDDTAEMLPKSRRALTIQEIAALARSSLHGEFRQEPSLRD